eukprot:32036_1
MSTLQFRKEIILEEINNASSVDRLLPMLYLVGLDALKQMLKQKVQKLDVLETSKLFCETLSLETVLPMDIIGRITSFYNVSHVQSVSKTFQKCYQQNEAIEMKQKEKEIISKLQINDNHATYVVDRTRNELRDDEIELHYKGPIHDISDAIALATDGDTILVYNESTGHFELEEDEPLSSQLVLNIDKRLQIIGMRDYVWISYNKINVMRDVYFKRIRLSVVQRVNVAPRCTLFMNYCHVRFDLQGIAVEDESAIDANHCRFEGDSDWSSDAISIGEKAKCVNIRHCVFGKDPLVWQNETDCCCIFFRVSDDSYINTQLRIIDNVFLKMGGTPVATDHDGGPRFRVWVPRFATNTPIIEANRSNVKDIMEYFIDTTRPWIDDL